MSSARLDSERGGKCVSNIPINWSRSRTSFGSVVLYIFSDITPNLLIHVFLLDEQVVSGLSPREHVKPWVSLLKQAQLAVFRDGSCGKRLQE